jgi:TrbC/VIRB2 pilin
MLNWLKGKASKLSKKAVAAATSAMAVMAMASSAFAAPSTGNTDLDNVITQLETGATSLKTGAIYVIGFIILIAIAIYGIRWIWGIFRGWMAAAR